MKAFNSFFRTIWLVMFVLVVFGWLVRDRFQLAEELALVTSQNAGLRSQLAQYSNSLAQLQAELQAKRDVEIKLQQLSADFSALQVNLAGANNRISQLEQQLAAEQATRGQIENDFALYRTSCDSVKQSMNNDIRLCREMVASIRNGQPGSGAGSPLQVEQVAQQAIVPAKAGVGGMFPLRYGNTYIGVLILVLSIIIGAIGVIAEKRTVNRRTAPTRTHRDRQTERQPLDLRRNAPAPGRPSGRAGRE